MTNFGERLAYWYLRLNGFLLVEGFVLHWEDRERTSDADLLGVRLRDSVESINGVHLPLHVAIQDRVGAMPARKHVALVVQVKTGTAMGAGDAFKGDRLRRALQFVGAVPQDVVQDVVQNLDGRPTASTSDWTFAKVLVADDPRQSDAVGIRLNDALGFIEQRLRDHVNRKAADRMFFPDELMQFLTWRARHERPPHG